jgi:hypothetical protein
MTYGINSSSRSLAAELNGSQKSTIMCEPGVLRHVTTTVSAAGAPIAVLAPLSQVFVLRAVSAFCLNGALVAYGYLVGSIQLKSAPPIIGDPALHSFLYFSPVGADFVVKKTINFNDWGGMGLTIPDGYALYLGFRGITTGPTFQTPASDPNYNVDLYYDLIDVPLNAIPTPTT